MLSMSCWKHPTRPGGRLGDNVPLSDPVPKLEIGVLTRKEKPSPLRAAFQQALETALQAQA